MTIIENGGTTRQRRLSITVNFSRALTAGESVTLKRNGVGIGSTSEVGATSFVTLDTSEEDLRFISLAYVATFVPATGTSTDTPPEFDVSINDHYFSAVSAVFPLAVDPAALPLPLNAIHVWDVRDTFSFSSGSWIDRINNLPIHFSTSADGFCSFRTVPQNRYKTRSMRVTRGLEAVTEAIADFGTGLVLPPQWTMVVVGHPVTQLNPTSGYGNLLFGYSYDSSVGLPGPLTSWDATQVVPGVTIGSDPQTVSLVYTDFTRPGARGNTSRSSGKVYFELVDHGATPMWAGIRTFTPFNPLDAYGDDAWPDTGVIAVFWPPNNEMYVVDNGEYPVYTPGVTWSGNTLQVAVDIDAGTLQLGVNNVWGNVMSIPNLAGQAITPTAICANNGAVPQQVEMRTDAASFTGTIPSGYVAFDAGSTVFPTMGEPEGVFVNGLSGTAVNAFNANSEPMDVVPVSSKWWTMTSDTVADQVKVYVDNPSLPVAEQTFDTATSGQGDSTIAGFFPTNGASPVDYELTNIIVYDKVLTTADRYKVADYIKLVWLAEPPRITNNTGTLVSGTVNAAYSATILSTDGTGPFTWSWNGAVPGLSFANGVLSGTPTAADTYTFDITVTDSLGKSGSKSFSLEVEGVGGFGINYGNFYGG